MSVKIDFDSGQLEAFVKDVAPKAVIEALVGADNFALNVMEDSMEQIPVDTNTARSTAFVDKRIVRDTAEVVFGYDGYAINPKTNQLAADYLPTLHEDLEAVHPKGKAKFLEDPLNAHTRNLEKLVADAMSGLFKK